MTGVIHQPSTPYPDARFAPVRRSTALMFRYRFGQSPARSLKGLDAIYLLTRYHPHTVELACLDCPILQQAVNMLDMVAKLFRCLLGCQKIVHSFLVVLPQSTLCHRSKPMSSLARYTFQFSVCSGAQDTHAFSWLQTLGAGRAHRLWLPIAAAPKGGRNKLSAVPGTCDDWLLGG